MSFRFYASLCVFPIRFFISPHLSLCLHFSGSLCLSPFSLFSQLCLSIYLFAYPSVCLIVYLSVCPSVCQPVPLSLNPSFPLSLPSSPLPFLSHTLILPLCLSLHLSLSVLPLPRLLSLPIVSLPESPFISKASDNEMFPRRCRSEGMPITNRITSLQYFLSSDPAIYHRRCQRSSVL